MLNKLWRILATGIAFSLFGFGGLFIALFVLPIQRLFIRDTAKQQKLARTTVHHTFKHFISFMSITGISTFNVNERQHLQQISGQLILANHPSLIDVVLLISLVPNANCVVKAHLFRNPFMRGVINNTGYISNDDPEELIQDCNAALQAGHNLIIFPEGTRTTPGKPIKFQRGAANIALRCQATLCCITLKVEPATLTKTEKWYQVPEKKFEVCLKVIATTPKFTHLTSTPISKGSRIFTRELEQFFREEIHNNDGLKS
ncbi:1-acyl-sn-glycerol-3-phosphate acyltransferase [Colwellia sp. D2M02]|uniref:Lysophospholipid acyltransferase family protein n=1 Tax=Colwellia asteriadis TaxID=517723 RepID=A0ABN1L7D9_9GAMM|nr:lysophospholipid acyltransferase family protein [Colwellia sp. D2M02]MBU2891996.1 1-acyl-sn-glycerol-3-phosphate acyltransferase [Colwellia sp. D2M02]